MLCARCLRRLPRSSRIQCFRLISTTLSNRLPSDPPAATSTSAAQPFSTPFTPTPSSLGISSKTAPLDSDGKSRTKSSVKAGTPLRGLGFIKGKEAPIAKEDSEYPEWLWGLLDKDKWKEEQSDKGDADMFCKYFGWHAITNSVPFPAKAGFELEEKISKQQNTHKRSIHFLPIFSTTIQKLTPLPLPSSPSKIQKKTPPRREKSPQHRTRPPDPGNPHPSTNN